MISILELHIMFITYGEGLIQLSFVRRDKSWNVTIRTHCLWIYWMAIIKPSMRKDINKLKEFYDTTNNILIYFDNHKNNDTYCLDDYLRLISEFFENGKATESGGVEPLIMENLHVFHATDSACLCFIARYNSLPTPAIRATMYL